jgi:hypothetical protein
MSTYTLAYRADRKQVILEVPVVSLWDGVAMVRVTLSKVDNPEDTRTFSYPVDKFLKLHLAGTEDNTRKIKQIKEERAKLQSPFQNLWHWICQSVSICIPKQRRAEGRSNGSVTSNTHLCSTTCDSLSLGSEPVRLRDLLNDLKLIRCCRNKKDGMTKLYTTQQERLPRRYPRSAIR